MFSKIVLAIDGSEGSEKAVPVAIELARLSGGEVLILHVAEPVVLRVASQYQQPVLDLAPIEERFQQAGVKAEGRVSISGTSGVAREILDNAQGYGADCIVVGSRGLGNLGGLLVGSVATKVVSLADCPVVVVR